jgi:hypothetical protein
MLSTVTWLRAQRYGVLFLAVAKDQSWDCTASYSVGTGCSFCGDKAANSCEVN